MARLRRGGARGGCGGCRCSRAALRQAGDSHDIPQVLPPASILPASYIMSRAAVVRPVLFWIRFCYSFSTVCMSDGDADNICTAYTLCLPSLYPSQRGVICWTHASTCAALQQLHNLIVPASRTNVAASGLSGFARSLLRGAMMNIHLLRWQSGSNIHLLARQAGTYNTSVVMSLPKPQHDLLAKNHDRP